jgi:hypothetical protein
MEERHLFNEYNISNNTLDLKIKDVSIKSAKDLINYNRIDLIAKYIYIQAKVTGVNYEYAKEIYKAHIEAFSYGKYVERGQESSKNNIETFYKVFDELINEISENGFNPAVSKIPIDNNGIIIDGAHRVSICAYYNLPILASIFNIEGQKYDYSFFNNRMLESKYLDYLVHKYIEIKKKGIYAMCLWPSAFSKKKLVKEILQEHVGIVYEKQVQLNTKGAHSFISQIYSHHDWVGTPREMFHGAHNKANNCFKNYKSPITLFVLESDVALSEILKLKELIRTKIGLDKHSVHITDNFEETKQISELLLNGNSVYQMNYGNPLKYPKGVECVLKFKNYLLENNWNLDDILIDGSLSMEVFGIRKADDIDFISDKIIPKTKTYSQRSKEELFKLYGDNWDNLNTPDSYFYYFGLKFITLSEVLKSKERRNEKKDRKDTLLLIEFLENNKLSRNTEMLFSIKKNAMLIKRKLRILISRTLKTLGLFNVIKRIVSTK